VFGPKILARTLTVPVPGTGGRTWQYHPRSDRHSKVACWGLLFDLLSEDGVLRQQAAAGRLGFGINHEMRDFARNRKKNLDLVICKRDPLAATPAKFIDLVRKYGISLTEDEHRRLASLPDLFQATPTTVLVALESKACMTEHSKARPRLYDELNSSHLTIHGDTDDAIAAGLAVVNAAETFVSPLRNSGPADVLKGDQVTRHRQPKATEVVLEKLQELPRRTRPGEVGYDAFGVVVVKCSNDERPCTVVERSELALPAIFEYEQFVRRLSQIYATRFASV